MNDTELTRRNRGIKTSLIGIIANLLLFAVKYAVGMLSGSISVVADSFNNLSDTGSSVVTLIGFKLSGKPADEEHPFGHGRLEYVCGLFVSFVILLLGVELIKSSVIKIAAPDTVEFNPIMIGLLLLTIPVKIYLARHNSKVGAEIDSIAMAAASKDALNDVVVTSATIISAGISYFTSIKVDGYIGIIVALFVVYSGIGILRDILGPLLGQAPDKALVEKIRDRVLSTEGVSGIHDLIIHNYGPGKYIASVHAEVASDIDVMKMHDALDLAERDVQTEFDILLTIHLDPIDVDDEKTNQLKGLMSSIIEEINPEFTLHDFRIVSGDTHTNIIFDLVIPRKTKIDCVKTKDEIDRRLHASYPSYYTVINFERSFI